MEHVSSKALAADGGASRAGDGITVAVGAAVTMVAAIRAVTMVAAIPADTIITKAKRPPGADPAEAVSFWS